MKSIEETNTKACYFAHYPRDFANEYTVYAVPSSHATEFRDAAAAHGQELEGLEPSRAYYLGTQMPAEYRRDQQQHYGGWAHEQSLDPLAEFHDSDLESACSPEDLVAGSIAQLPEGWDYNDDRGDAGADSYFAWRERDAEICNRFEVCIHVHVEASDIESHSLWTGGEHAATVGSFEAAVDAYDDAIAEIRREVLEGGDSP